MMKGTIAVESEQGKGTTVIVCLPQKVTGSGVVGKELAENLQNFQTGGENQIKRSQMSFEPMPYGKVLVVDDVESNLFVAKGLLSPYRLQIETAFSGSEAIEKIKNLANQEPGGMYDIVFMDQMMPHMDGIETVKNIRTWENKQNLSNEYKHIPIVALTANAVVGQSDIFFANGFDGFISKPIDVRELNVILKKYVRDKQPPEVIEAAQQAEALKHNNGNGKTFAADTPNDSSHGTTSPLLAEIFVRDTRKAIVLLEDVLHKHERFQHEKDKAGSDLQLFTVTVHGLKNALANVRETDLSALAAKLEQAGSNKDITVITEETPVLIEGLRRSIEKLAPEDSTDAETEMTEENRSGMKEKLLVIKKACDAFNQKAARRTLNELKERKWPSEIRELLGLMTENLLSGNMEETSNTADKIIEKIRG
jgi:CheY-like chemotaxis protein